MVGLTTHILDISIGRPASGVMIDLYRRQPVAEKLSTVSTNEDGRCDHPLLSGEEFKVGQYELVFHIGAYFDQQGLSLPSPKFIDEAVIRFGIATCDQHYHVPLLVSPFGYSTYRGS